MASDPYADPLTDQRYSTVAVWLHWIIAVLLVTNLFLGFFHGDFGRPAESWMMFFHKAIGISVLALTLVRLAWRLTHRPPPFDPAVKSWEAGLATAVHWGFYALLVAIPLTGWMLSSSSDRPTNYFGLFQIARCRFRAAMRRTTCSRRCTSCSASSPSASSSSTSRGR